MRESASTVNITYETPTRANPSRSSSRHHRDLEGVPKSTAQQMARDFAAYQHEPSATNEKKLYKYRPPGQGGASESEVSVALDFGEIVALEVDRQRESPVQTRGLSLA